MIPPKLLFVLLGSLVYIMETLFIGKNCIEVDKTGSTNSYLARLHAEKTLFEGAVVITKHQEQGRGQRGASWESEPGKNLTLSLLLTPTFLRPDEQFQLNKAVSLGVLEFVVYALMQASPKSSPKERTFTRYHLSLGEGRGEAAVKWPNDIYIGTKKVAGILIENSVSGNSLQQSIVGIGINVNQEKFSSDLPNPTSLKLITGNNFDLKQCLGQLCYCIEKRYLDLRTTKISKIDTEYLKSLYRFGEFGDYKYREEAIKAKITGVTKSGMLLLQTENGKELECDLKELRFC